MKASEPTFNRLFILLVVFLGTDGCIGLIDSNDHNRGIIVSDYPQAAIPADKWSCYVPGAVYLFQDSVRNNIVIDTEAKLRAYFDYRRYYIPNQFSNFPCLQFEPEAVDFTKYTLLGQYANGGCDVAFTRTVERDDDAKTYTYTVKVREAGACKKLEYSMNWVLVPKLPVGYKVEFRVK